MANPDFCDFLMKINLFYLRKLLKLYKSNNGLKTKCNGYFLQIGGSFSLLIEWFSLTENKLKENYLKVFFQNCYEFSLNFFKGNPENSRNIFEIHPVILCRIIFSWLKLHKKYFKSKGMEMMNLYFEFFRSFREYMSDNNNKNEFFYDDKKNQNKKIYLFPYLIDFFLDQYEALSLPNPYIVKKIFEILIELLYCFPINFTRY